MLRSAAANEASGFSVPALTDASAGTSLGVGTQDALLARARKGLYALCSP